MNPVLATTLEFDEYVKEKLRASRVGIPRSSSNSKGRPVGGPSGETRTHGANRPNSASIQQRNSHRFHVNNASTNVTNSNNVNSKPSSNLRSSRITDPLPSPPLFEIAHSWKAHLRPPKEVTIPSVTQDVSRESKVFVPSSSYLSPLQQRQVTRHLYQRHHETKDNQEEEEEKYKDNQNTNSPPYLELLNDSFSKKVSMLTPSPSHYGRSSHDFPSSTSTMSSENIKVRIFRLKKLFRAWRAHSLRQTSLLNRWEQVVKEQHLEYLFMGSFDNWKCLWLADSFNKCQSRKRMHSLLFRWIKRTRQALRWKLVVRHSYLRRSFRKWYEIIREKRKQARFAALEKAAISFQDHRILRRILKAWKRHHRTQQHVKEVEGSRQVTLGRISAFLQRLDSAPDNHNNMTTNNDNSNGKNTETSSVSSSNTRRSLSSRHSRISNISHHHNRSTTNDSTHRMNTSNNHHSSISTHRAISTARASRVTVEGTINPTVGNKPSINKHMFAESKAAATSLSRSRNDNDSHSSLLNGGNVSQSANNDDGEDDWAEAEPRQALPKPLTPHKAPQNLYSHNSNNPSIETDIYNTIDSSVSAPPSYRHFIEENDSKESFSTVEEKLSEHNILDSNSPYLTNTKANNSSNNNDHNDKNETLEQFTSRKDRLVFLQQRAQERVQKRREEMKQQQELKAQQEAENAARILQEAKRKKQEQHEKSLLHRKEVRQTQLIVHRADSFRRKWLMVHHGLAPWIRYINRWHRQHQQAVQFANRHLLTNIWQLLKVYVQTRKAERIRKEYGQSLLATNHHRRRLLRQIFKHWQLYRKLLRAKARALMGHFSRRTLPKRVFQAWKMAYARSIRLTNARMQRDIIPFGNRVVKRFYWQQWMEFLQEKRLAREIDYRSEMKWQAVQSWLRK